MNPRTAAHFQALASFLWPLLLVWTALGLFVMPLHSWSISEVQVREQLSNPELRDAVLLLLTSFTPFWFVLAASCTYLHTVEAEGLPTARRWAGLVLGGSAVLCFLGATTGFPFGPFAYTGVLGFRFARILPFAAPLLWLVVILCSRYTLLCLLPRALQWSRWQLALATSTLVLLTDLNMEPIAWKMLAWWTWYPGRIISPTLPPVQNYATWFLVAFCFSLAFRENRKSPPAPFFLGSHRNPTIILGLMNALFLAFHWLRW